MAYGFIQFTLGARFQWGDSRNYHLFFDTVDSLIQIQLATIDINIDIAGHVTLLWNYRFIFCFSPDKTNKEASGVSTTILLMIPK